MSADSSVCAAWILTRPCRFSDHYYPLNLTKLQDDIALVGSADKVYLAGEYDWTGNVASAPSLQSFYDIVEAQQNNSKPVIAGDLFWSLFMHGRPSQDAAIQSGGILIETSDVPNCGIYVNHSDGFTLHYGDAENTAQNNTQIATIREHFFKMKGESPGPVSLPIGMNVESVLLITTVDADYRCIAPCPGPLADLTYT